MSIKHVRPLVVACASMLFVSTGWSMEVTPVGQFQVQADYDSTASGDDADWGLSAPRTELGLDVVETTSTRGFRGVFRIGLSSLESPDAELLESYIQGWQGGFTFYAGRLPTLEQVYLVENTPRFMGFSGGGLVSANQVSQFDDEAIRFDYAASENISSSFQWARASDSDDVEWRSSVLLSTPEGSTSITVRSDNDNAWVWGNQITYLAGDWSLSTVLLYQDELLSWDVIAQAQLPQLKTTIAYGVDENDDGRWALGLQYGFADQVTGFSEVAWRTALSGFDWATGLRMAF